MHPWQSREHHYVHRKASIGTAGDFPFLEFRAADGRVRAALQVNMYNKPDLLLYDEDDLRVGLGVLQSDTASPEDNDCGLIFKPDRVWLGMIATKRGGRTYYQGGLTVHRDSVQFPYGPPK